VSTTQVPDTQARAEPRPAHRRRHRWTWLLVVTVVAAGAVAATLTATRAGAAHPRAAAPVPTAPVQRTDLVGTQQINGTLGDAGSYRIVAAGAAGGTLTWLPGAGDVIRRGQRAYGANGHSVPLFYGSVPMWRALQYGVSNGRDVRELERNLAALGFGGGMTVDGHFSPATTDAVEAWQAHLGVAQTGVVSPGDVVIQPGALRVSSVTAVPGTAAAGVLYVATGTRRIVTVSMPVDSEQLAAHRAKVDVELPGGAATAGHVSFVGSVAQAGHQSSEAGVGAQDQGSQGTQTATIQVRISLDHPAAARRFTGAPVTVDFTTAVRRDVLAVPVTALLAEPGGGYAVEAVAGTHRRLVPVRLGMFAAGNVQVSGSGVREGMRVEVPGS
jgi:peptidoglycan hydrolase-like protein with peptidoglycan-binding domain